MLSDVTVVSLAVNLPGPLTAYKLQKKGANITKIEPPAGDPLYHAFPAWYEDLNKHQTIFTCDLNKDTGRQKLHKQLAGADILLTASRPSTLKKLGLEWQQLHHDYPRLNHVAIVSGQPPETEKPGHDLLFQAAQGLVDPPQLPRLLLADYVGAEQAVTKACELLYASTRSGTGLHAYVSLFDALNHYTDPLRHAATTSKGALGGARPEYNIYPTQKGWVALAALEKHFTQRLKKELGLTELTYAKLRSIFQEQSAEEWYKWALKNDIPLIPLSPTHDSKEAL